MNETQLRLNLKTAKPMSAEDQARFEAWQKQMVENEKPKGGTLVSGLNHAEVFPTATYNFPNGFD